MRAFEPGEPVVWRTVVDGRVRTAIPHRCLSHDGDRLVLWRPPGTIYKRPSGPYGAGPRGRSLDASRWDGTHRDLIWEGPGIVLFHSIGDRHTSWAFADGSGWYVNLEAPWEPNPVGYDTRDLMLDVVIDADLRSWEWKDVDECDEAVASGRLPAADAERARHEGEQVAREAMLRAWPFDGSLEALGTLGAEPLPTLPDGWDAVIASP